MNYSSGYSAQGQIAGALIGQSSGNTQPSPPATLSSLIGALDERVSQALEVLSRVGQVADHLLGGIPRPVANAKDAPEPTNLVDRLKQRDQQLAYVLQEINSEISRLGNAL